ncbi:MAG: hypothetical protein HS104_21105 [Polyangiaceae bacterium]|nr:hypothetical protein [Polyangiaceae bacterium]MCE7889662.1 hypothetical protein [Sorangiineae bacterium PRO1]MCL4749705.1 hypothetical protein [Myxococcales bacterium]
MQILIELDRETFRRLEAAAPAKSRKRSAFIRAAIQRALWELEEEKTRQAYLVTPDHDPPAFDAAAWEPLPHGGFDAPEASPRARRTRSAGTARVRKGVRKGGR